MTADHRTVITCSAIKFTEILKYYGKGDVVTLSFLNLLYKLMDNPNMTIEFDCNRKLEELAAKIQMSNPNICTVPVSSGTIQGGEIVIPTNTAPTVDDGSADYDTSDYTFNVGDFTTNFYDADGDSPETVRIVSLPINGILTYLGNPISANFEFDIDTVGLLVYTQTPEETIDTFNFRISDDNTNKLFSNMALFTLNINEVINQCPDAVGINAITIPNGSTYVFTLANFTTETTPAYSDPEGDPAESVKITATPATGELQLDGVLIVTNDTIDVADISAGLFTYVADPENASEIIEPFNFSISDTGAHCFTPGGVMTMTAEAFVNLPPDVVGDGELTVAEGYVITFTRVDFTSNTTPPYHDPEGDIADKLKIIALATTGDIKLDGVDVLINDIINFSDIDAGKLSYVQDAGAGGTTPVFSFEIADAGSGIFVG